MIKRDITETVYEYDNEGKLIKKTIIETHEEEEEMITTSTWQTYPNLTNPCFDKISTVPYCNEIQKDSVSILDTHTSTNVTQKG